MIPWLWIFVAAWVGGVTLGLLNAVGVHQIAGGSRFNGQYYFFVFAWPISVPFLIVMTHFHSGALDPKMRSTFRYLADVEEPEPLYEVAEVFKVCEPCKAVLQEPYEWRPLPELCEDCQKRRTEWQDQEIAKQQARFARLCEPCRQGLGIELHSKGVVVS